MVAAPYGPSTEGRRGAWRFCCGLNRLVGSEPLRAVPGSDPARAAIAAPAARHHDAPWPCREHHRISRARPVRRMAAHSGTRARALIRDPLQLRMHAGTRTYAWTDLMMRLHAIRWKVWDIAARCVLHWFTTFCIISLKPSHGQVPT